MKYSSNLVAPVALGIALVAMILGFILLDLRTGAGVALIGFGNLGLHKIFDHL